ncbi:peptide/nickel transport system substrate-binding protein [Bradyrhizobium sp. GM2.4]
MLLDLQKVRLVDSQKIGEWHMLRLNPLLVLGAMVAVSATPVLAARGTDDAVRLLFPQAPSLMNPYLSGGEKEAVAASLVLEPLAGYDENGKLFPRLAAEIPTIDNGGISRDLKSIKWKLQPGLKWSDGTPLTSKDIVFTAKYCMDPGVGCASVTHFESVEDVEALDDLTVKVNFKGPMAVPFGPFTSAHSPIIQAKQFADCVGAKAPTCTEANFNPIGTGPFVVANFKPNDSIQLKANPNYRDSNKPAFAEVNIKGGGDALAAARAVLQTGEYDYSADVTIAPDVLKKMEGTGKGRVFVDFGSLVEVLLMNLTDPSPSLAAAERSTAKYPNPILSDVRVRKALSMALDRATLAQIGYGFMGRPTCDLVTAPSVFAAKNAMCLKQDIQGAKELLEESGWKPAADGTREKNGNKLKLVFQAPTNAVRQQFQAIIKQWWSQIGVDVELRNINTSVFFGSDPGNPDTYQRFYADVEMFAYYYAGTDPGSYVASNTCDKAPAPVNQWQGSNPTRYCNKQYDALVDELSKAVEIEKRAEIVKKLNNMMTVDDYAFVPLVQRGKVSAISNRLDGYTLNVWDSDLWNAQDWFRKK